MQEAENEAQVSDERRINGDRGRGYDLIRK